MSTYFLLPPSESKAPGGKRPWDPGDNDLGNARSVIATSLRDFARNANDNEARKFFGISGDHLKRALTTASTGLVGTPAMAAGARYTGVVWQHLALGTLETEIRKFASRNAMIVSGLGGLFTAGEAMPDYRLKMSARLHGIGLVSTWWKPILMSKAKTKFGRHTVVDLLGKEQVAAIDVAGIARHTIRVRFMSASGTAAAGHAAKQAKGLLARSLVKHHRDDLVAVCADFKDTAFRFLDTTSIGSVTTVRLAPKAT